MHAQQKLLSFQWLRQGSNYSEILLIFLTHLYFWDHFSPSPVPRADGGNLTVGNAAGLLAAWPVKACSGKACPPSCVCFRVQGKGTAKSHMQSQEPRVNPSSAESPALSFKFLSASAFLFYFFLLKVLPCFLPSGPFSASREIWEMLGETENHTHLSYLCVFVWRNLTNSSCFHAPSRQISGCFRNSWYKSLMDTQYFPNCIFSPFCSFGFHFVIYVLQELLSAAQAIHVF